MSRGGDRQAAAPLLAAAAAATAAAGLWWRWRRRSPEAVFQDALARLDSAHRAPFSKKGEAEYCEAVERWVVRLRGLAGERVTPALRLGARAQHLERGAIPRASYPEGRDGYLRWRAAVKKRQGKRVSELLGGLDGALGRGCVERVCALVAKSLPLCPHPCSPRALGDLDGPPAGDAEMQCIEDAACLVFLEKDLQDGFADGKQDEKMVDIVAKTWKKMSRLAHAEALKVEYSPRMLGCTVEAIARAELGDEGALGGVEAADAVPRPSVPTAAVLAETWAEAERGGPGSFGEAWYEELRADPAYASDLGRVLNHPVCRARNVSRLVQLLLDLVSDRADPLEAAAQRLRAVLRAATALSQRHAGLRLRHVDAMRTALVGAACRLTAHCGGGAPEERRRRNAWESFGFAVGAVVAPVLMLSDPGHDFCGAVATPLPTPGAGPCSSLLAAQGAALLEMSVGLLRRKRAAAAAAEPKDAAGPDRRAEEIAGRLAEIRAAACEAACLDAHAYCGLLAEAIFDAAGGDKEERSRRRAEWTRRCTEVPLQVAALAAEAARLGAEAGAEVRAGAPSVRGDLETGLALLLTAGQVSLHTVEFNIGGGSGMDAFRERSEAIGASLAEVKSLVQA